MATQTDLAQNALKNPGEMAFAAFAEAVKPTAAINRFPSIGPGKDVFSYTVYMNGPLAQSLPDHAREHTYNDVALHALTEKLQLSSDSARDNRLVSEIVALRSAWMSAVLEASVDPSFQLSQQVSKDYELLTEGVSHPWITAQLDEQRALTSRIRPALERAGAAVGASIKDVIPKEVSVGPIIAQDTDFSLQRTQDGEVVTHENRRLDVLPPLGAEVTVSYYRGSGQVVASLENLKVSPPFIDPISGDLAVVIEDNSGPGQMVLFNSVVGFDKFVKAHGMDRSVVRQALDARAAVPKEQQHKPEPILVKPPYLDGKSNCLAIDYKEAGVTYTAMFRSAHEMGEYARVFGLGDRPMAIARALDEARGPVSVRERASTHSFEDLADALSQKGAAVIKQSGEEGHKYIGPIVAENALHVAQDVGRGQLVIHSKDSLDKVPSVGDRLTIQFVGGRGVVADMSKPDHGVSR